MITIITHVGLKKGAEPEWDMAMRERLASARQRPGWVGGQLLIPLDGIDRRVIVGTWLTRADWEAWHNDPTFQETRRRLDGLEAESSRHEWHEVIEDVRKPATPLGAAA